MSGIEASWLGMPPQMGELEADQQACFAWAAAHRFHLHIRLKWACSTPLREAVRDAGDDRGRSRGFAAARAD